MRSAQYVCHADPLAVEVIRQSIMSQIGDIDSLCDDGMVTPLDVDLAQDLIVENLFKEAKPSCVEVVAYVTPWVGPHVDEVPFDYTVGLILQGDHILYTGRGRKVCDLTPGAVYVLNNKKMHGAKRAKSNSGPLLFVAADFAAYSDSDARRYVV